MFATNHSQQKALFPAETNLLWTFSFKSSHSDAVMSAYSSNYIKSCVSFMIAGLTTDDVPFDRLDNAIKAICFIMTIPLFFFIYTTQLSLIHASHIIRNPTLLYDKRETDYLATKRHNKPNSFVTQTKIRHCI